MPTNKSIWIWLTLLTAYFASRLFHLTLLPMFVDEATHLKWAMDIIEKGQFPGGFTSRYFPIWVLSLVIPYADHHLLLAARLMAVAVGLLGLLGCYGLGQQLFQRQVGLLAAILYLVVPYTFFHDRMALVDGLLTVEAIYIVLFSFSLSHQPTLPKSVGLGIVLGLSFCTKQYGLMLAALPIVVFISQFTRPLRWPSPTSWKLLLLGYGISLLGFIPYLLDKVPAGGTEIWSHFGDKMLLKHQSTSIEWIWLSNGHDALLYLAQNLSIPVFVMLCLGVGLTLKRGQRNEWLLLGAASVTLLIFIFLSKANGWYPRYLLPAVPFLLLTTAQTMWLTAQFISTKISSPRPNVVLMALTALIILPSLWFDYWLLVDPSLAPFVEIDRWQYVSGDHAGYGLLEANAYLRDQLAQSNKLALVYDKHLADFLPVYFYDQRPQVQHIILEFKKHNADSLIKKMAVTTATTFIVTSDLPDKKGKIDLETWSHVKPVARFERPGGLTSVNVYQVIWNNSTKP